VYSDIGCELWGILAGGGELCSRLGVVLDVLRVYLEEEALKVKEMVRAENFRPSNEHGHRARHGTARHDKARTRTSWRKMSPNFWCGDQFSTRGERSLSSLVL